MDSGRIQITICCSKNYTNKSSGGLEVTYETHLRKKSLSDDEVKLPLFPLRILCSLAQGKDFLVLIKNWTFSFFNPKLLAATVVIKLLSLLWPPLLNSEVKSYFSNTKTFLKSMVLNWGYIYQRRDLKCYVLFALSIESFIFTFSKKQTKKEHSSKAYSSQEIWMWCFWIMYIHFSCWSYFLITIPLYTEHIHCQSQKPHHQNPHIHQT